jgi:hypothetical protein
MNLSPITADDYPRLLPFFRPQPYRLCSYSLSAIIAWQNDNYRPLAGVDGDSVVVAADFNNSPDLRHLILPVPYLERYDPERLHRLARDTGYDKYWFVPACYLDTWGRASVEQYFRISRQADYDDYIYRASDLAELKGNRFAKKRNLINQFTANFVDAGRARPEPITRDNISDCADFLEQWCAIMACGSDTENDLACEKIAVLNTLRHHDVFDVRGVAVRIDGEVSAFGMGSRLTGDMGVLQFEKAYTDVKGLYQYLDNLCARELFNGYAYINKESDMGIAGLAKAKKSYHPVEIVKSHKLTVR